MQFCMHYFLFIVYFYFRPVLDSVKDIGRDFNPPKNVLHFYIYFPHKN
jgi:hypothetical protein